MFDNIGDKIKKLAKVETVIGIGISIIMGFLLLVNGSIHSIFTGILVMILGVLISWVSSFALYGFGELIEKVSQMDRCMRELREEKKSQSVQGQVFVQRWVEQPAQAHEDKAAEKRNETYVETPKYEELKDWRCYYCKTLNDKESKKCKYCGQMKRI